MTTIAETKTIQDSLKTIHGSLRTSAICLVAIPSTLLLRAWILTVLWGWYLAPVFNAPLRLSVAFGLSLLFSVLMGTTPPRSDKALDDKPLAAGDVVKMHIIYLMTLLIGWVGTLFL